MYLINSKQVIIIFFCCLSACVSNFQNGKKAHIVYQVEKQQNVNYYSQPDKNCHLKEKKLRPFWIDNPPQNDQYFFGIGVAPKQMPLSNQIKAAKILAMQDITQQINVHIDSLYQESITQNHININSHVRLSTHEWLKRVKVIDQWNDVVQCNIYILVSVAKEVE